MLSAVLLLMLNNHDTTNIFNSSSLLDKTDVTASLVWLILQYPGYELCYTKQWLLLIL